MLPVKLMEYLYIGIAVVAPNLPVLRRYFGSDMIEYYEPENVDDLARALVKLALDRERRELLARKAAGFFEEHSWKVQQQRYLELLDRLRMECL
jgi:glycosyltransferase involved in cell wall biosynthesis